MSALTLFAVLGGCGGEDAGDPGAAPSTGGAGGPTATAGQGGAQDIGAFRAILDQGLLPGPHTLDDVGFFNEHAFETDRDPCPDNLCVAGRLGVQGNMLNGGNCTVVMVTMSTGAVVDLEQRPPLNLAIAVDTSQAMAGASIEAVRSSLSLMRTELRADDRVTLVAFDSTARLIVDGAAGDDPNLQLWFDNLRAEGKTNLYDGLRLALEAVERHRGEGRTDRVVLLSGSRPDTGILLADRIVRLMESFGRQGTGLTAIGYGQSATLDLPLLTRLAESGAGNLYTVADAQDLLEVFTEELTTALVPVATDVQIAFEGSEGYKVRAIHGTHRAEITDLHGASIDIPAVFVAHRKGASDNANGRRGGGGAILIELAPSNGVVTSDVGALHLSWRAPGSDAVHEQLVEITSRLSPGETPEAGLFDDAAVEKGFVALNVYVGLRVAAIAAQRGDLQDALGTLAALDRSVTSWVALNDDADIADDLALVQQFVNNLIAAGAIAPPPSWVVPDPWPQD